MPKIYTHIFSQSCVKPLYLMRSHDVLRVDKIKDMFYKKRKFCILDRKYEHELRSTYNESYDPAYLRYSTNYDKNDDELIIFRYQTKKEVDDEIKEIFKKKKSLLN